MIFALSCPFCPPYVEGKQYKGNIRDPKHPERWICGDCGNEQPFSPYSKVGYYRDFPVGHDITDLIPEGAREGLKRRPGLWEVEVRFYPTVEVNRHDADGNVVGLDQSLEVTCFNCQEKYTVRALCPEAPGGARYSSEKDFCRKCEGTNLDVRPTGVPPPLPVEPISVTVTKTDGKTKFIRGAGPKKGKLPR